MKNGFWDRVLIYLHVLLSVALVALVVLQAFGLDLIGDFTANLKAQAPGILWNLIILGIAAILALLGCFVMAAVLPVRVKKRDFITLTNDENGQVRIALPALREMARHAVGDSAGVRDMTVDVTDSSDAIKVSISLDVVSGTHVPTVTMNMQRAVKSYIQMNCGVAVKDVSVVINSVTPAPEAPAAPQAAEPPKAEPPKSVELPQQAPEAERAPVAEPEPEPDPELEGSTAFGYVEIPGDEVSDPEPSAEAAGEQVAG